jgi:hypothetical protein
MSWIQAINLLQRTIGKMSVPSDGMEWINRLKKAECKDARRLGFCIAIDVASGALTIAEVAGVLNEMDSRETCPRRAFAKALVKSSGSVTRICTSRLKVPLSKDSYLKILTIGDFITYYKKNLSLAPDDVEAVRTDYFSPYAAMDLADIREWWSSSNGVVWVMSREEYEALANGMSANELATLLNDALGLGKDITRTENDGSEFVGVSYPADFDIARQPTTFDASWMNFGSYYVSAGKHDGWGRTVSCSGTHNGLRERVHPEFEGLTSEFEGFPIGEVLDRTFDRSALLKTAEGRLKLALTPPRPLKSGPKPPGP